MESLISDVAALVQVVLIDLALSADNAVAVGLAAATLPETQRRRAIAWGVLLALALRVLFGLLTVELMHVPGLLLVGGLTLFWIAWRMWRDLPGNEPPAGVAQAENASARAKEITFPHALLSIVVANIALSLDNVLAVAGVARNTPAIMAFGLILSVLLMGAAASLIARIIDSHRWIAYVGIAVIVLAGIMMCWDDLSHFFPTFIPPTPLWLGGKG